MATTEWIVADVLVGVASLFMFLFVSVFMATLKYYLGKAWWTLRARICTWIALAMLTIAISSFLKAFAFQLSFVHRSAEVLGVIFVLEAFSVLVFYWISLYHRTYRPQLTAIIKRRMKVIHVTCSVVISVIALIAFVLFSSGSFDFVVFYTFAMVGLTFCAMTLATGFFVYGRRLRRSLKEHSASMAKSGGTTASVNTAAQSAFARVNRITTFSISFFTVASIVFAIMAVLTVSGNSFVYDRLWIMYLVYYLLLTHFPLAVMVRFFYMSPSTLRNRGFMQSSRARDQTQSLMSS
jgi:hypothetical protein